MSSQGSTVFEKKMPQTDNIFSFINKDLKELTCVVLGNPTVGKFCHLLFDKRHQNTLFLSLSSYNQFLQKKCIRIIIIYLPSNYKDWLLHSLDSKKRFTLFHMELFKSELQL